MRYRPFRKEHLRCNGVSVCGHHCPASHKVERRAWDVQPQGAIPSRQALDALFATPASEAARQVGSNLPAYILRSVLDTIRDLLDASPLRHQRLLGAIDAVRSGIQDADRNQWEILSLLSTHCAPHLLCAGMCQDLQDLQYVERLVQVRRGH